MYFWDGLGLFIQPTHAERRLLHLAGVDVNLSAAPIGDSSYSFQFNPICWTVWGKRLMNCPKYNSWIPTFSLRLLDYYDHFLLGSNVPNTVKAFAYAFRPEDSIPFLGLVILLYLRYMILVIVVQSIYAASDSIRPYISLLLTPPRRNDDERQQFFRHFQDLSIPFVGSHDNHTHGKSASLRKAAREHAEAVAKTCGYDVFMFQMSKSDTTRGYDGHRTYYFPKDVGIPTRLAHIGPNHMLTLVDVDYYLDMNILLTYYDNPVYVYGFLPETAGNTNEDFSYAFDRENYVSYDVAGGASYRHMLWNYDMDTVMITSWTQISGMTIQSLIECYDPKVSIYAIERRGFGMEHTATVFFPKAKYFGFQAVLAYYMFRDPAKMPNFTRIKPVVGDYVRLRVSSQDGFKVSTSRVGAHVSATIPQSLDDKFISVINSKTQPISNAVTTALTDDPDSCQILTDYYKHCEEPATQKVSTYIFPRKDAIRGFTHETKRTDDFPDSVLTVVCNPFVDRCFAPCRGIYDQSAAYHGRIEKVASHVTEMSAFVRSCAYDWISYTFPIGRKRLHPVDPEEVAVRQDRPTQRRILELAFTLPNLRNLRRRRTKNFIKPEPYPKPNHPRIISTIEEEDKALWSMFMYALSDELKDAKDESGERYHKWYAFGQTPAEIADRVAEICSEVWSVDESDLNRQDGTISPLARELCLMLMKQCFHHDYHVEIERLLKTQYDCIATFMKDMDGFFLKYFTGTARASGSPETSLFNTWLAAFCAYLALRFELGGTDISHHETAIRRMGIYGGDDGLTRHIDPRHWNRAAKALGFDLDIVTKKRHIQAPRNHKVMFLSRIYGPYVWTGDTTSCCDMLRILSKFHTTPRSNNAFTDEDKVVMKAMGLILTDAATPVVGDIMKSILKCADLNSAMIGGKSIDKFIQSPSNEDLIDLIPTGLVSWWVHAPKDAQWPNVYCDWMDDVADDCGFDYTSLSAWRNTCTHCTLTQFINSIPLIREPEVTPTPKASVQTSDGEVVKGSEPEQDKAIDRIAKEAMEKQTHTHKAKTKGQGGSEKPPPKPASTPGKGAPSLGKKGRRKPKASQSERPKTSKEEKK
jgi:hypothetical protein